MTCQAMLQTADFRTYTYPCLTFDDHFDCRTWPCFRHSHSNQANLLVVYASLLNIARRYTARFLVNFAIGHVEVDYKVTWNWPWRTTMTESSLREAMIREGCRRTGASCWIARNFRSRGVSSRNLWRHLQFQPMPRGSQGKFRNSKSWDFVY